MHGARRTSALIATEAQFDAFNNLKLPNAHKKPVALLLHGVEDKLHPWRQKRTNCFGFLHKVNSFLFCTNSHLRLYFH